MCVEVKANRRINGGQQHSYTASQRKSSTPHQPCSAAAQGYIRPQPSPTSLLQFFPAPQLRTSRKLRLRYCMRQPASRTLMRGSAPVPIASARPAFLPACEACLGEAPERQPAAADMWLDGQEPEARMRRPEDAGPTWRVRVEPHCQRGFPRGRAASAFGGWSRAGSIWCRCRWLGRLKVASSPDHIKETVLGR